MNKVNKENIYEIENKLINDVACDVWTNAQDNDGENMKSLAYIHGVVEMASALIEFMEQTCNLCEDTTSNNV